MDGRIQSQVKYFVPFAFLGIASDFFVSGLLKFIWIAIYAPTHLAAAMTIGSYFLSSKKRRYSMLVSVGYLAGVAVGHLAFEDHQSTRSYPMRLAEMEQEEPIALTSPEFTESLYVTDDRLRASLGNSSLGSVIDMTAALVTDYGCLQAFTVKTVGGIDVESDPNATWTWRLTKVGIRQTDTPPPLLANPQPWCQFHLDQLKGL